MHIRKYDFDYGRRIFLEKLAMGVMAGGVLAPLWSTIAHSGEITKAYPEELLSIEAWTKGKVKVGDVLTPDNVEYVKDLLDPIAYLQVKQMQRRITIVETSTDITTLFPHEYLEATLSNKGKHKLDENGNVVTLDGKAWIGGNPFPEPNSALEAYANLVLNWGRHNVSSYAIRSWDLDGNGDMAYEYDWLWVEMNGIGITGPDGPYFRGEDDKLRYQTIWFTSPNDTKGTSFLSVWYADQRKFPDLFGYIPAFKRVRRFPTNQRFEPIVPGFTFFLSDAWGAGDPMLTWGNYKIIDRKPHLGAMSHNWYPENPNWERPTHGGLKGQTYFDVQMEFIPEAIVIEQEPVGYPRAPVSKRHIWLDARNMMYIGNITYDRRGELWKSFEPGYSQYKKGDAAFMDGGHPLWSWCYVMSHDIQTNRMTRFYQAEKIKGGVEVVYNDPEAYDRYLTIQAIRRLGK